VPGDRWSAVAPVQWNPCWLPFVARCHHRRRLRFCVNGAAKDTGTTLKLSVPGAYDSVECKSSTGGAIKTRSMQVTANQPAAAIFKQ
jgi:hypothetical protein